MYNVYSKQYMAVIKSGIINYKHFYEHIYEIQNILLNMLLYY